MVALRSGTVATPSLPTPLASPSHSVCVATVDALIDDGIFPTPTDDSPSKVLDSLLRTSSALPQEQQGDAGHVSIVTAAGTSRAVVVGTVVASAVASNDEAAVGGNR